MKPEDREKCLKVANDNGVSEKQAMNCWDGLIGCIGCPIKRKEN